MVLTGWMRRAAGLLTALAIAGCGGGSGTPTRSSPATVNPASPVQLDSANFEPLVLASARPGVVEFHSPT